MNHKVYIDADGDIWANVDEHGCLYSVHYFTSHDFKNKTLEQIIAAGFGPLTELVPGEQYKPQTPTPKYVIDGTEDLWYLCGNGYYSLFEDSKDAHFSLKSLEEYYGPLTYKK